MWRPYGAFVNGDGTDMNASDFKFKILLRGGRTAQVLSLRLVQKRYLDDFQ